MELVGFHSAENSIGKFSCKLLLELGFHANPQVFFLLIILSPRVLIFFPLKTQAALAKCEVGLATALPLAANKSLFTQPN